MAFNDVVVEIAKRKASKNVHQHIDEKGIWHTCYHKCKNNWVGFIVGLTVGFPIEHLLWEKVWPFNVITRWLGL